MAQELSLPLELEREIFETTALTDRAMIPTLLLVCHRVHAWLEPLLYRVLAFTQKKSETLLAAMESAIKSKPAGFLQGAVRHVYLEFPGARPPTQLRRYIALLERCSGVTNLSVDGEFEAQLLPALSVMRLQRLALMVPIPSLNHPLFLSVTHLDVYAFAAPPHLESWETWSHLVSLPALTHLCLSRPISGAILPQVVGECPKLAVVLTISDSAAFVESLTVTDPRVVVTTLEVYHEDWIEGAWGGDDVWARAEQFLAQKRRGEIPSTCYFLESP
ncbi:hypothetical protein FB451DRAFT_1226997 [Mycena latifolia]|nr:hypothetical protein FB451DRAFT_1226997 [Mycena latifolia]